MKYFAPILLILICSLSLIAQTPPQPLPTPYAETTEAWQNFAPAEDKFTLEVPGAVTPGFVQPNPVPIADASPMPGTADIKPPPADPTKSRFYMTLVNGDYYFIFSDAVAAPSQNRVVYTFAEAQAPGIEPNEIYTFTDDSGYHHKILVIKSEDRVYTFQTVSSTRGSASAKRFFDGIKIKGVRLQLKENVAVQNIEAENPPSFRCNPAPLLPPTTTEGNGIGSNNTSVKAAPPYPPSTPSTPVQTILKILAKPRANYTDLARFYQITGSVQFRVTFLANGKTGSISTVKRLPFGLTEQAMLAACEMKFEPAGKNGVPYTVTKQVIYNFTLY